MADVHPVHHLFPIKKPVFIAFHAVGNLYKGQEKVSDEPDSNPVHPVIPSKNMTLSSLCFICGYKAVEKNVGSSPL